MKKLTGIHRSSGPHWVGDGFHVRSVFDYNGLGRELSPFLLLNYGAPTEFPPGSERRGMGAHPHRGFETVTLAYQGEVQHRDSLLKADIPNVPLAQDAGTVRVIAGKYGGHTGPAKTFTPINLWDVSLRAGKSAELPLPDGHTTALLVLGGTVSVKGEREATEGVLAVFARKGDGITVEANSDALLLVMDGEPIAEPIVGQGPFVMNSRAEIAQAFEDHQSGRMGEIPS